MSSSLFSCSAAQKNRRIFAGDNRPRALLAESLEARLLLTAGPAAVLSAQPVIAAGNTILSLTVTYTYPAGINGSSIAPANISVTGPGGQNLVVSYDTLNSDSGKTATVIYAVNAPGGNFVPAGVFAASGNYFPYSSGTGSAQPFVATDNGTYTVSINANSVLGSNGTPATAGVIGTFTVNVPSATTTETQFEHTIIDPNPLAPGFQGPDRYLRQWRSRTHRRTSRQ